MRARAGCWRAPSPAGRAGCGRGDAGRASWPSRRRTGYDRRLAPHRLETAAMDIPAAVSYWQDLSPQQIARLAAEDT
ncbi:hypothetical protein RZS08_46815, partial [Arthrospira platensis SPKY1]|nr:hypothetical protein [Arthrospira platensis SPKY1]